LGFLSLTTFRQLQQHLLLKFERSAALLDSFSQRVDALIHQVETVALLLDRVEQQAKRYAWTTALLFSHGRFDFLSRFRPELHSFLYSFTWLRHTPARFLLNRSFFGSANRDPLSSYKQLPERIHRLSRQDVGIELANASRSDWIHATGA
jgi:hypothetical protein